MSQRGDGLNDIYDESLTVRKKLSTGSFEMPTGAGAAKVLTSDANGTGTWQTAAGGSPGGNDTHVQYNDDGAFGGDAGLTYAKATDKLTVSGGVTAPLVSTASGELKMEMTGDYYGGCQLLLQNRGGSNGPLFYANYPAEYSYLKLVDFGFIPGSAYQSNIRVEARPHAWAGVKSLSNEGLEEFQFLDNSTNGAGAYYTLISGRYATVFYPNVSPTIAGNVGITINEPSARLHLPAGTATAGTAPLKFTSGTNLTTAEDGAMEYDGTDLFFTQGTPTRQYIAKSAGKGLSVTITTAQLTTSGSQGSMTFVNGVLTAQTAAT